MQQKNVNRVALWPWFLGVTVLGIGYVFIDFDVFARLIGSKAQYVVDHWSEDNT